MTRLLSLPLLALATLAACSSAPTPTPSTPAPVDSAPVADSGWTPVDPRIVRCGIDDRPRNVVSALPPSAARPLLAEAIATRPGDAAPAVRRRPSPPVDPIAPDPDPGLDDLEVDPQPLTSPSGGPVPASLSSVDPHYEVCASLAQQSEALGVVLFGLEMAPNGSPLRVLPPSGSGTPTPLVRCLMERACQLVATASPPGQKTQLGVPLRLHRGGQTVVQPRLPPRPPTADIALDVATVSPRPERSELQLQLRGATGGAMRSCGAVPGRARVRLSLDLVLLSAPRSPRRPRRVVAFVESRNLRVTGQRTEAIEGTVSSAVLGCVVNLIGQQSFADSGVAAGAKLSEQLILTWNP